MRRKLPAIDLADLERVHGGAMGPGERKDPTGIIIIGFVALGAASLAFGTGRPPKR
jgi:hypothetical protein